jgi:zinc transport system substrate-binding protein
MRAAFAALLAATLAAILPVPAVAAEPLRVYAVSAPLADFAARLGGDRVAATFPVPPGRDPAFWRPSIALIAEFQSADLILLNGAGFAAWTEKVSLPRARTVDTSRGFADRYIRTEGVTHSHGPEGEHSHAALAAETWLDFAQAAEQARAVAAALTRRAPDAESDVVARLAALEADLAALDARARALGAALAGVRVIASHPRYQYFARAYGVEIASLDWDAGAAPTEAQWAEFDRLRGDALRALMLWEAEPAPEAAQALAARGVAGAVFDPAAGGDPTGRGFVDRMRANLDRIEAALTAM